MIGTLRKNHDNEVRSVDATDSEVYSNQLSAISLQQSVYSTQASAKYLNGGQPNPEGCYSGSLAYPLLTLALIREINHDSSQHLAKFQLLSA